MRDVTVKLGDKARELRYDFNGLCDLERALGRPMFGVIRDLPAMPFADIRDFVWAGLRHASDAAVASPRQVGDLIVAELRSGRQRLFDFWQLIDNALVESGVFGDPVEIEKKSKELDEKKAADEGNAPAS